MDRNDELAIIDELAKLMANRVGHGMREKCEVYAEVAVEFLSTLAAFGERTAPKTPTGSVRLVAFQSINEEGDARDFVLELLDRGVPMVAAIKTGKKWRVTGQG